MLARRVSRLIVLLLLALGILFALPVPRVCKTTALLLVLCGHALFLLLEFIAAYRLNRRDPLPRAGIGMLARAWLTEVLTVPPVFCWQQPFRSTALPDCLTVASGPDGPRGIVFIHGFICNRGFWNAWLRRLRGQGQVFSAVNLEPVFASIDSYVPVIEAAVQRVTQATGRAPVLVCHSMGGLAARAWLRAHQADARVHRIITIGTPHQGTWLARFAFVTNGRQARLSSDWLRQLARDEPAARARLFTCYYSNSDNVVFPTSAAVLPGADNRLLPGVSHVALAFDERIMREVLACVRQNP